MKKIIIMAAVAIAALSSCRKINGPETNGEGTLSFAGLEIQYDSEVVTKASSAPGNYAIFVYDDSGEQVYKTTYSEAQASGGVTLEAGNYKLEARSTEDPIPAAIFEVPVYGASTNFTINAGETTEIGSLTCTLQQCKVTVDYDSEFLKDVTGDCQTTVTVTAGSPLVYQLAYNNGNISYDKSAGYFGIPSGTTKGGEEGLVPSSTMTVVFKGSINGKSQKMTAALVGVQARQWRQITYHKKIDEQGNATFEISINSFIDDKELVVPMTVENEAVIGDDPNAPKGDGGITLEFSEGCSYTDLLNIVVPDPAVSAMDLRFDITVPNGVKKFIVDIDSDSADFINSVKLTGSTQLDLISPLESQGLVFDIVPFPHGESLVGQTELVFDLSAAQEPIFAFPGHHTFTMTITDQKGCKNSIPVVLVVE